MLTPKTVSFAMLECSFCRTLHATRAEAEAHGCANYDDPTPAFAVDDIVVATFTVGAGIEAVGSYTNRGRVTAVAKPSGATPIGELSRVGYGHDRLSFLSSRHGHEWMYRVEPLEPHPNPNRYVSLEWLPQSKLRISDEVKKAS
jgi:hypothetical protein